MMNNYITAMGGLKQYKPLKTISMVGSQLSLAPFSIDIYF
jgi:hypothetical protein